MLAFVLYLLGFVRQAAGVDFASLAPAAGTCRLCLGIRLRKVQDTVQYPVSVF